MRGEKYLARNVRVLSKKFTLAKFSNQKIEHPLPAPLSGITAVLNDLPSIKQTYI